jgi:hypothetical protein
MSAEIIQTLITTVGTILVALITVVVKTKLDYRLAQNKKKVDEAINETDAFEMLAIQEWLNNFRTNYDFERASIFQFHNGGKFFHGKSMKKFSMTYESVAPGYEKLKRVQQNILTSEYPQWVTRMLSDKCFLTDTQNVDYKDQRELEKLGVTQFVTVPIYSIEKQLVGFIVGHNIGEKDKDVMTHQEQMIEDAKILSGYVSHR